MITERPWVIGGLISATTTVVILGLIVVTQPRGGDDALPDKTSALVAAAAQAPALPASAPGGATGSSSTTSTKAAAKAKATAKAKANKAKAAAKAKARARAKAKARAAASAPRGIGGAGVGRIQFGRTYTGKATFYAATGAGNCSFEASSDLMVGAMNQADYENSQACGARLSVTGPNGTVTIRVVDRCPECPPGAIDLSREAFEKIAPVSAGRVSISWRLLSPAGLGNVSYRYKSGSSQYWCGIQVRNHRNPVKSLQVKSGGRWKTLTRQTYNYFVSDGGGGCGGAIRITDIYGNRLTATGIKIAPDTDQRSKAQFPAR